MGGPAQPMPQDMMPPQGMPPQGMPPPAMEQQVQNAESMGQEIGVKKAAEMMGTIDAAEDYQTLIDGIRGNSMPLESRYQELAGLVGEQDALSTPESVLALAQPTIMMTEQGAMDSGIGELMQGISGSVDMEGPMEEGVGSLMAAGAGNTPPVNFRNGGPVEVRGYQDGTEVRPGGGSRILNQAEKNVSQYENYFAGGFDQKARAAALQEQREMTQAQMLFDIAGTALNFAGNTQGGSIAERLANSASQTQLTDKIGQRSAGMLQAKQAQAAEDRQMRMAARDASLGQSQADEAARNALELARAKKKNGEAKYQRLVGEDGKLLGTFNIGTDKGITDLDAAIAKNPEANLFNLGTEPSDSGKSDLKIVVSKDGKEKTFDLNTADGKSGFETASAQDGAKVYNVSTAPSDAGYKYITIYDPADPTVAITKPTNTAEERKVVSELLAKDYTTDDKRAAAAISEEFTIKKEDRAAIAAIDAEKRNLTTTIAAEKRNLTTTIAAEARLLDTTIGSEKRAVLTLIAREGRAKTQVIAAEARLKETTLGSEERATATRIAQEARDAVTAIAAEGRNLKAQIAAEKRNLITTIASEDRATDRETVVYGRNRADELADIDAQVASTIATEERALGRTLNAEERAQVTWETRNTVTTKNDLDRLAVAQGLRDASQINAEDRAAIVAQNEFDRDQSAQIAKENRAVANRDTIELREMDGELVRVDTLTGETEVIFGDPTVPDPSMAQVTLPNADGVPVTTVVDITSPQGKALIEKVNAANAAPGGAGSASYQKVPTASTAVRGFLVPGEGVFTSYDGKTYVDEAGNAKPLPGGAFEVSSTIAYEVAKNEKMAVGAQAQLDALDTELLKGMTKVDGSALSRADMAEVKDAFAAARKGTGFWSKVYAGLDAVAGGLAPEAFGDLFTDTTDARQFVKMVRVMGRSALASSPRFAVADLQTVEQLFPNEQALLASPKTEARKLNDIVGYLSEEKVRILEMFAGGTPMDSTMKSTLNQKLFEIDRLESILGPVTMLGQASVNQEAIDAAKASMRKKKN